MPKNQKENHKTKKQKGAKKIEKEIIPDQYVLRAWSNLNNPQTALSSLTQFAKSRGNAVNIKRLAESLSKIESYSIHKRLLKNYKRPSYIITGVGKSFCSDLADVSNISHSNSGINWLLISLDQFSRKLSVVGLKRKSAEELEVGLAKAIKELRPKKGALWATDMGLEFRNKKVKDLMKRKEIIFYAMQTNNKTAFCENKIKLFKQSLYKYFSLHKTKKYVNVLQRLVTLHNTRVHTVTGISPNLVSTKNEDEIFSRIYKKLVTKKRPPPAFHVNQKVRISSKRLVFQKMYKPGFSKKKFIITKVLDTFPVFSFKLSTEEGQPLPSSFVSSELSLSS